MERQQDALEDVRGLVERMLLSAPVDNVLWKACEYIAFREVPVEKPVLDLGCGDGGFASLLFEEPPAVGLDIRLGRVRKAAARHRYHLTVQGDACRLPFRDGVFGTVFSACVFEHIPQVERALSEVSRVLRPGGHFVFSVPSHLFESYLSLPGFKTLSRTYTGVVNWLLSMYHFYSPSCWRRMLSGVGLRLRRIRYIMPARAMTFWGHSFVWGNVLFTGLRAFYLTPLRWKLARLFARMLMPFLRDTKPAAGGGLVLVAEKPHPGESSD